MLQLQAVLDHLTEGLVITDPAGNMLHWNPVAVQMHGFATAADWQRPLSEFGDIFELATPAGKILPVNEWPLARILRGEIVRECEIHARRKDMDWRRVLSYAGALAHDAAGKPMVAVVTITDITARKRAEHKLQASERWFRALTEKAAEDIILLDANGRITYESPHETPLLGFVSGEMTGHSCFELVHPDDLPFARQTFARILDHAGATAQGELRMGHRDGRWSWIHFSATNLLPDEAVGAVVLNLYDISERKEAEQKLRASEERLQQGINVARLGLFEHDHRTDLIYYSPLMREINGWKDTAPVTLQRILAAVHPDDRATFLSAVKRAHDPAGNGQFITEHRIVQPNGIIRWVSARAQTTFEGEGAARRPARTIGALVDITERKQAEARLRYQLRLTRDIANNTAAAIFVTDGKGCITFLNTEAERVFGYSRTELLGRILHDALHHHHPDGCPFPMNECPLAKIFSSGETVRNHEDVFFRKDGSPIHVSCSNSRLELDDAWPGTVIVLHDITARKQAETALRESEQTLRLVMDTVPHGIFAKDETGHFVLANQAMARFAGLTPEQMVGHTDAELFGVPEQIANFRQTDAEVIRSGQSKMIQEELLTDAQARTRVLQTTKVPFTVPATGAAAVLGVAVDITERKQAEARFRDLLESAPDAMVIHDQRGQIVLVNAQAERLFGYDRSEMVGQPIELLIPPRYHHSHIQDRLAYAQQPRTRQMGPGLELFGRRKDGGEFPAEVSLSPLESDDGVLISSAVRDITTRKATEQALLQARDKLEHRVAERTAELARTNEQLKTEIAERVEAEQALRRQAELLDMASDAIIIRDEDGIIRYWNRGAERVYGYTPAQAIGQPIQPLLRSVYPNGWEALETALAKTGVWIGEIAQTSRTGRPLIVESHQQRVLQPDGRTVVLVTNHDITERVQMNDEIVAAGERERERIGQNLHDGLCQILTAARLKTDSLMTRISGEDAATGRSLKSIATLIVQAVDEARDLARGLEPVEHLPEGLMSALHQLATTTSRLFNVACTCEFPQSVLVLDHKVATALFRIAQEATNNAIKHSRAGTIQIRLIREGKAGVLTVISDGKPFPKHPRTSGMGLKTMRFRAERIGATLEVKRGPRKGTIVRCVLPTLPENPGESAVTESRPSQLNILNILSNPPAASQRSPEPPKGGTS
ncbi:MAG TPA: PAS domain S-box protein [Verrucomicrobiae bacterium]|nr:PAS domain S-box protein [Verrucomicrobiae bacterium]